MLAASSMAPVHFIGQDSWNEVQHTYFGHIRPVVLAVASYHADGIINGTIPLFLVKTFEVRCNMNFWSCNTTGIGAGTMWCWVSSMAPLYSLAQDEWNEVEHNFSGHLDTIGTDTHITWCQWYHCIP